MNRKSRKPHRRSPNPTDVSHGLKIPSTTKTSADSNRTYAAFTIGLETKVAIPAPVTIKVTLWRETELLNRGINRNVQRERRNVTTTNRRDINAIDLLSERLSVQ